MAAKIFGMDSHKTDHHAWADAAVRDLLNTCRMRAAVMLSWLDEEW